MQTSMAKLFAVGFCLLVVMIGLDAAGQPRKKKPEAAFSPNIPKTWDDEAMASLEVPLADAHTAPLHIPADYYYRMPVRPIYKSYPIYAPGKEPPGYLDWLKQQEPEIVPETVFDPAQLKTEADWIKAGELVFDALTTYEGEQGGFVAVADVRNPAWYEQTGTPIAKDGTSSG